MISRHLDDGAGQTALDEYLAYSEESGSGRHQSPVYSSMLLIIFFALLAFIVGYGLKTLLRSPSV